MPVWAEVAADAKAAGHHGVGLCGTDFTTLDLPHKRFQSGPVTYFVCQLLEGDFALHHWTARNQEGYGGGKVSFLMEDGTVETVKGPFYGSNFWDSGFSKMLKDATGYDASAVVSKLQIGVHLPRHYFNDPHAPEIFYDELEWVLGDIEERVLKIIEEHKGTWPDKFEVCVRLRSANYYRCYPAHFVKE